VQRKKQIDAYLDGSDIVAKYAQPSDRTNASSRTIHITFRSPLETRSMDFSRDLKAVDLWEIGFRLTKGRYPSYELQHCNARVPAPQEPITSVINIAYEVFITPLTSTKSTDSNETEELCLVKLYGPTDNQNNVVSYWIPKQTTKSLASTVFRYYRQKFMQKSTYHVEPPFVFWRRLTDTGDNHTSGYLQDAHWLPITNYFNCIDSTGKLEEEGMVDKIPDDDSSADTDMDDDPPHFLKLQLQRKRSTSGNRATLSRLDVLKQMFDAYVNRLLAYNFQTHLGLVSFSTKSSVVQKITQAVENFRHKLNNMEASGDTAIWDSIALAQDQLQDYAKHYPNARLRIICSSDGEDNRSQNNAYSLPSSLIRNGIVVDSFCLGNGSENTDLKTISFLTGGYVFQPKSLEEAMAICEMEPVLSLLERQDMARKDSFHLRKYLANPGLYNFRTSAHMGKVERASRDEFPDRKKHPQLAESFVELGHFKKTPSANRTDGNMRLSRIHSEIRNSGAKPHPHYDIFICESNMGLWKIVMQGKSAFLLLTSKNSSLIVQLYANQPRST
jgi:hypothetical protein